MSQRSFKHTPGLVCQSGSDQMEPYKLAEGPKTVVIALIWCYKSWSLVVMVRWSLWEGRLNIKKKKKQSVPGKRVVVVRWSFYGRSFWYFVKCHQFVVKKFPSMHKFLQTKIFKSRFIANKNGKSQKPYGLREASLFIGWGRDNGEGGQRNRTMWKGGATNFELPPEGGGAKNFWLVHFCNVPKTWFFSGFGVSWVLFIFLV